MKQKLLLVYSVLFLFILAGFVSAYSQSNNTESNATFSYENNATYSQSNNTESNATTNIKEQVTCIFSNSTEIQKCYTVDNNFYCSGTNEQQSCTLNISGNEGEELGWMSSCGAYNITIIDGKDKTIEFDCSVSQENAPGFGYAYAYYGCYDGTSGQIQSTPSCKSYDSWKNIANNKNLCKDKCGLTEVEIGKGIYENQTKCGIKSIGVSQECQQGLLDRLINWFKSLFG